ncbi:unnamed protein product [Sphacelaria rigidula]
MVETADSQDDRDGTIGRWGRTSMARYDVCCGKIVGAVVFVLVAVLGHLALEQPHTVSNGCHTLCCICVYAMGACFFACHC